MIKVWLIEDGCYSDYRVVGVYSTEEKAWDVASALGLTKDTVHEWELNPMWNEINKGMNVYQVIMLRDGTTESILRQSLSPYGCESRSFFWDRPKAEAYKGKGVPAAVNATVWARNEKHAIKVVNEIRTRMIANGEWK